MKYQISCVILIIFCIRSTLNTACDDAGMTTSPLCIANTTCEWKENTTAGGTCGPTTTNTAGANCVGSAKDACNGKCFWNADPVSPACEDGTKNSTGGACTDASITTKAACDGNCTWTGVYYCTAKTTTPTSDPAQGSGFGLKNSILIALGFFLF